MISFPTSTQGSGGEQLTAEQGWHQDRAGVEGVEPLCPPRLGDARAPTLPAHSQALNRLCRGKAMSTTFRTAINYLPWEQRCNCDERKRWENTAVKFNAFSAITATAAKMFLVLSLQQQ